MRHFYQFWQFPNPEGRRSLPLVCMWEVPMGIQYGLNADDYAIWCLFFYVSRNVLGTLSSELSLEIIKEIIA